MAPIATVASLADAPPTLDEQAIRKCRASRITLKPEHRRLLKLRAAERDADGLGGGMSAVLEIVIDDCMEFAAICPEHRAWLRQCAARREAAGLRGGVPAAMAAVFDEAIARERGGA